MRKYPVFQNSPGIGVPGKDYDTSAHHILMQLIALNIVVLVTAGYSSYWLARRTLQPIEAAHEQQKRFTADVSHELRTPLTAIKMESEVALMNAKTSPKELRDTIQSNLEEVGKLERLINNLLRLTRLEADELQQRFEPVSSKAAINAAVEQVQKAADDRKITVTPKINDSIVSGDQESLIQLLVILLDNAIKYSPANSTVTVEAKQQKDQVLWQVKDNGAGIEKEALEHVFDRFYRANNSRTKQTTETTGFGLGLSIAEMIANVHNGTITLTSRPNHGTTAAILLPSLPPAPKT
jgi:two-component system sensor histidine kinase CiaH